MQRWWCAVPLLLFIALSVGASLPPLLDADPADIDFLRPLLQRLSLDEVGLIDTRNGVASLPRRPALGVLSRACYVYSTLLVQYKVRGRSCADFSAALPLHTHWTRLCELLASSLPLPLSDPDQCLSTTIPAKHVSFPVAFDVAFQFCSSIHSLDVDVRLSVVCASSLAQFRVHSPRTLLLLGASLVRLGDGVLASRALRACIARVFAVGLGDDSSLSLGPFDVLGSGIASLTSHQALEDGITQRSFALLLWALNNQGDFSHLLSVSMARMLAPAPDYIDPSPFPLAWRAALFLVNLTAIRQMATVGSIAIDALLDPATSTVIVPASDVITMPFASPAMSRSVATSAAIRSVSQEQCSIASFAHFWSSSLSPALLERLARSYSTIAECTVAGASCDAFDDVRDALASRLAGRRFFVNSQALTSTLTAASTPVTALPTPVSRIRIGYLSADFRRHPIGNLVQSLFAHHDRGRFEVYCFAMLVGSIQYRRDEDAVTRRIRQSCDHFIELYSESTFVDANGVETVRQASDDETQIARRIAEAQIDVLIDLHGWSDGRRLLALCARPAPIQITWLGHAGTLGAHVDYMFVDPVVAPLPLAAFPYRAFSDTDVDFEVGNVTGAASLRDAHAEKLIFLPDSYMLGSHKAIALDGDLVSEHNVRAVDDEADGLRVDAAALHADPNELSSVRAHFGLLCSSCEMLVALHQTRKWWSSLHLWLPILRRRPHAFLYLPAPFFSDEVMGQSKPLSLNQLVAFLMLSFPVYSLFVLAQTSPGSLRLREGPVEDLDSMSQPCRLQNIENTSLIAHCVRVVALQNVAAEAIAHNVSTDRIWLLPRLASRSSHLRRLAAFDLFLDSVQFTGMSTVLDALWVGLPVLTGALSGPSYARAHPLHANLSIQARTSVSLVLASQCGHVDSVNAHSAHVYARAWQAVRHRSVAVDPLGGTVSEHDQAESLIHNIWAMHLQQRLTLHPTIARSDEDFISKAVHLLASGELPVLRQCLVTKRLSSPLFDDQRFVANMEAGIALAWQRFRERQPAEHIVVAPAPRSS